MGIYIYRIYDHIPLNRFAGIIKIGNALKVNGIWRIGHNKRLRFPRKWGATFIMKLEERRHMQ